MAFFLLEFSILQGYTLGYEKQKYYQQLLYLKYWHRARMKVISIIRNKCPSVSFWAFVALAIIFPGSFFYLYLVAREWLPKLPFFAHRTLPLLIVLVCLVGIAFGRFLPFLRTNLNGSRWHATLKSPPALCLISASLCLIWVGAITYYGNRYRLPPNANGEILLFQWKVVGNYILFFLVGICLFPGLEKRREWVAFLFAACLLLLISCFSFRTLMIALPSNIDFNLYLFLGDAFAIWSIFTICLWSGGRTSPFLLIPLALLGCLLSGNRGALLSLLLSWAIVGGICAIARQKNRVSLLYGGMAGLALMSLIIAAIVLSGKAQQSRLLMTFYNRTSDNAMSWDKSGEVVECKDETGAKFVHLTSASNTPSQYSFPFPVSMVPMTRIRWRMKSDLNFYTTRVCLETDKGIYYMYYGAPGAGCPKVQGNNVYLPLKPTPSPSEWRSYEMDLKGDLRQSFTTDNPPQIRRVLNFWVGGDAWIDDVELVPEAGLPFLLSWIYGVSANERYVKFREQLPDLMDHWISGDYAGQLRRYGNIGDYIHNYLSFWHQYGLVPFLLLLFSFGLSTTMAWRKVASGGSDPALLLVLWLAVFNLVEAIFLRSFATPYIWLSISLTPMYFIASLHQPFRSDPPDSPLL